MAFCIVECKLMYAGLMIYAACFVAGVFQEVIVTNTIPTREETEFAELTVLSVSNLLGETIWKIYNQSPLEH
jgi:phosphoribosylpyrophosphate synthetase